MKKYLYNYIKEVDTLLEKETVPEDVIANHLIKIEFFQHERQIHLFVTLAYALFAIVSFAVYVLHYFHLENGVQYLYKQYDEMLKKVER